MFRNEYFFLKKIWNIGLCKEPLLKLKMSAFYRSNKVKMTILKTNKPETSEGRPDAMVVNTLIYQLELCLNIIRSLNPINVLDGALNISFASTLLKCTTGSLWYDFAQPVNAPPQWEFSKDAIFEYNSYEMIF